MPVYLSIVIPALNEATKIARDVEMAGVFLAGLDGGGEIIVVDDGSTDNTAAVARAVPVPAGVSRNVLRYSPNRGKGYAVRAGVLASSGTYVLMADSGVCVPFETVHLGIAHIKRGECEIAHGSRGLKESIILIKRTRERSFLSKLFNLTVPRFMGVDSRLTDTQCGFKVYRGDVARELFGESKVDGFMFDIELILISQRKNYRICEFPVEWTVDHDSRMHIRRHAGHILREMWAIRKRLRSS